MIARSAPFFFVPNGGLVTARSATSSISSVASLMRMSYSPVTSSTCSFASLRFFSMSCAASLSISMKVTFFAPSSSAPMPSMPVPAPRSTTCLFCMSPRCAASQSIVAAASEGVTYCSRCVFGFSNLLSLERMTASVALLMASVMVGFLI